MPAPGPTVKGLPAATPGAHQEAEAGSTPRRTKTLDEPPMEEASGSNRLRIGDPFPLYLVFK